MGSLLALALGACGDGAEHRLVVDVRTDLTPGVDFFTVEAALAAPADRRVIPAVMGQDFVGAVRLAEFDGLPEGNYQVVVTAADASGGVAGRRTVRVELTTDLSVTVTLSRSCQGVVCPMAGDDPARVTCAAGRCVEPECSDVAPERCAPGDCARDADCAPVVECNEGLCVEGGCLFVPDDSACAPEQLCAATLGCVDRGDPTDAGAPDAGAPDDSGTRDAGEPDAGERDAGEPDAGEPDAGTPGGCAPEVMLAESMTATRTGVFAGMMGVSEVVIVLAAEIGAGELVGDEADHGLAHGYSGIREFRASSDPDFDAVVTPLVEGTSSGFMGVTHSAGGGSFGTLRFAPSVRDATITMVRRNVRSLSLGPDGAGGTEYDATAVWQLWGCR